MALQTETLIAQKMALESKWNCQFLEQGQVTLDMLRIELELKRLKARINELSLQRTWQEVKTTEDEIESIDSIAS